MRTTTRLCLVASIAAAVGISAVPVASAAERPGSVNLGKVAHHKDAKQNKKIKKARKRAERAHDRINNVKEWNQSLSDWNTSQQTMIESLESTVATIVAGVPTITSALTQLQAGLLALQAALEGPVADGFSEIEDALNDSTTGLVGLNLARPQFGVFEGTGNFLAGTGPVNGTDPPHGPADDAVRLSAGTYVVDFENDVSQRVFTVTPAPTGGAGLTVSAVNCAAGAGSPSIAGACDAAVGAAGPHPNHVFVLLQNSTNAAPTDGTFTIVGLSG